MSELVKSIEMAAAHANVAWEAAYKAACRLQTEEAWQLSNELHQAAWRLSAAATQAAYLEMEVAA
jgi:hypothetical protein